MYRAASRVIERIKSKPHQEGLAHANSSSSGRFEQADRNREGDEVTPSSFNFMRETTEARRATMGNEPRTLQRREGGDRLSRSSSNPESTSFDAARAARDERITQWLRGIDGNNETGESPANRRASGNEISGNRDYREGGRSGVSDNPASDYSEGTSSSSVREYIQATRESRNWSSASEGSERSSASSDTSSASSDATSVFSERSSASSDATPVFSDTGSVHSDTGSVRPSTSDYAEHLELRGRPNKLIKDQERAEENERKLREGMKWLRDHIPGYDPNWRDPKNAEMRRMEWMMAIQGLATGAQSAVGGEAPKTE